MFRKNRSQKIAAAAGAVLLMSIACALSGASSNSSRSVPQLDDFKAICDGAGGVAGATPYAPQQSEVSPALYFDKRTADGDFLLQEFYGADRGLTVEDFTTVNDDYAPVQLVACQTTVETELVESCEYDVSGYDFYQDTELTGGSLTYESYINIYEVSVYEAASAELVASETLSSTPLDCPASITYEGSGWHTERDGQATSLGKSHEGKLTSYGISPVRAYLEEFTGP